MDQTSPVLPTSEPGGPGLGLGADEPCLSTEGGLDDWFRKGVFRKLQALRDGRLTIVDGERREFGQPGDLQAELMVLHPRFYRRVALGGALGAAESYLDGDWTTDDLLAVVRLFARNGAAAERFESTNLLTSATAKLAQWWHRNSKTNSRRNIAAHYDLGNDFFSLFLDETMCYSCGIFEQPTTTLDEASIAKIDLLCRKLQLAASDRLVEIGTGWGALAVHAARNYGCHVTTTTISRKQHEYARQQIQQANAGNRVTLLDRDYRELTGQFDKLVSVEMIEAVGHEYLPTFFRKCDELLKPGGRAAIQAITIPDERYEGYRRRIDFIQKYIFPGGCLPSHRVMAETMARHTRLRIEHVEEFGMHYATTLAQWRERFWSREQDLRALGLSDEFLRMWDWYFCYCEGAFREGQIGLAQLVLVKG